MINSKFLAIQLRQLWLILLIFCLFTILFVGIDLIGNSYLSSFTTRSGDAHNWSGSGGMGAGTTMYSVLVIGLTMLLSFILSIVLISRLFVREINRGYIGSWLTLPMSRASIISSKLVAAFIYITIYHVVSFIFQELFFGILMKDFSLDVALLLIGGNVTMYFTGLLFLGLVWIIYMAINKSAIATTVCSIITAVFVVFYMIGTPLTKDMSPLYILKYITILAFTTNPLSFDYLHPVVIGPDEYNYVSYGPLLINTLHFAWQIPAPIVVSVPLFVGGAILMRNKNLSI